MLLFQFLFDLGLNVFWKTLLSWGAFSNEISTAYLFVLFISNISLSLILDSHIEQSLSRIGNLKHVASLVFI